ATSRLRRARICSARKPAGSWNSTRYGFTARSTITTMSSRSTFCAWACLSFRERNIDTASHHLVGLLRTKTFPVLEPRVLAAGSTIPQLAVILAAAVDAVFARERDRVLVAGVG